MINSLFSKLVLRNVKTGKPSYSLTMTVVAFFVINLKLLFSGVEIVDKVKMSDFSGTDYAASLAAISGLHIFNKKANKDNKNVS